MLPVQPFFSTLLGGMSRLFATLVGFVLAPVLFISVVVPVLPERPSLGDVELTLAVTFLLVVTIWVVGPLGAWRRWWPSFLVYGLCSGSLVLLTLMPLYGLTLD